MSRPNYNEADTLRKGFATAAVQDGASEGDVPAVGADGELAFSAAPGGSQPWTQVAITAADSPYAAQPGQLIIVDAGDADVVINLPESPVPDGGAQIAVWLSQPPGVNTVRVQTDLFPINDASDIVLTARYDMLVVLFDGATQWAVQDQPGSQPFVAPPGDDVVILKNSTGDPIMSGGEDTGGVHIADVLQVTLLDVDEIQMNSGRIQNMADPVNPQDAATRAIVDALNILQGTNDPTASQNEIQQVDTQGSPDGGTYTLDLNGTTVGPINWDDDQTAVQSAYDAALGASQAIVTGDAASHTVEFDDTFGDRNEPLMTVTGNTLTNGVDPVADPVVTVNQEGFALLAGPVAAVYQRNNAGAGELWLKTSNVDGDWSKLALVP